MSDEDWVALGRAAPLADYIEEFGAAFGLDIRT
jgi:hypothetical protein